MSVGASKLMEEDIEFSDEEENPLNGPSRYA
jgi:hypothetical protein